MRKQKKQSILSFVIPVFTWFLLTACANAPKQLPKNPIDDPPIIPKKMNVHKFQATRRLFEQRGTSNWAEFILPGLFPGIGIAKNVDIPYLLTPYVRILLNKNDFYEIGRIKPKKWYHVISTGAFPLAYSDREGLYLGNVLGWKSVWRSAELLRLELPLFLAYSRNNTTEYANAVFYPKIELKLNSSSSLSLGPKFSSQSELEKLLPVGNFDGEELQEIEIRELAFVSYQNRFEGNWDFFASAGLGLLHSRQNSSEGPSTDFKNELDWDFQTGLIWHW